jgi:energy-coupling factor transporter ATP-binding protein EcfA2
MSARTGEGLEALVSYLVRGRTVAVLGTSGVGKSTLVNRLVGREVLATREVFVDGRGRHTTTHRQLALLPQGGLVLDTPGMRELRLWAGEESLDSTFQDVLAMIAECRSPTAPTTVSPVAPCWPRLPTVPCRPTAGRTTRSSSGSSARWRSAATRGSWRKSAAAAGRSTAAYAGPATELKP